MWHQETTGEAREKKITIELEQHLNKNENKHTLHSVMHINRSENIEH